MAQSSPRPLPPLTDFDDAMRRAGNRPEVASELYGLLQASLAAITTILRNAADEDDRRLLRETAHRLHGATLYCGVPRLRAAVAEVERLCDLDESGQLDQALARLLEAAEATREADDPVTGHTGA